MNLVLLFSVISWAVAQVLKVLIVLVWNRELNIRRILSSGGMPSSHSATVCACATTTGLTCGFQSASFGIAAILAFIVMYDAVNVRRETGEQSKVLNYIMENWDEGTAKPELFGRELKELIGHTPLQVFVGSVLGIVIALAGCLIARRFGSVTLAYNWKSI